MAVIQAPNLPTNPQDLYDTRNQWVKDDIASKDVMADDGARTTLTFDYNAVNANNGFIHTQANAHLLLQDGLALAGENKISQGQLHDIENLAREYGVVPDANNNASYMPSVSTLSDGQQAAWQQFSAPAAPTGSTPAVAPANDGNARTFASGASVSEEADGSVTVAPGLGQILSVSGNQILVTPQLSVQGQSAPKQITIPEGSQATRNADGTISITSSGGSDSPLGKRDLTGLVVGLFAAVVYGVVSGGVLGVEAAKTGNPLPFEVQQGNQNNCWFTSVLASIVNTDPNWVRNHVVPNGAFTTVVGLRDPNTGLVVPPITVPIDTRGGDSRLLYPNGSPTPWVAAVELASEWMLNARPYQGGPLGAATNTLNQVNRPPLAMNILTGTLDHQTTINPTDPNEDTAVFQDLQRDLATGQPGQATSRDDVQNDPQITASHGYAVTGVDPTNETVTLLDPGNPAVPIVVTIARFIALFAFIYAPMNYKPGSL